MKNQVFAYTITTFLERRFIKVIDALGDCDNPILKWINEQRLTLLLKFGVNIDFDVDKAYGYSWETLLYSFIRYTKDANVQAKEQFIKKITFLLEHGANPNVTNTRLTDYRHRDGSSVIERSAPIHIAAKGVEVEIVGLLLKYSADVNVVDENGQTALCKAMSSYYWELEERNINLITLLFKHNANPDTIDIYGNAPLHLAIMHESVKKVKLLLENKADANIIRNHKHEYTNEISRDTPLHMAMRMDRYSSFEERYEMIDLLLNYGANPDITNSNGNTPLHIAVKRYNKSKTERIAALLLKHKADVNIADNTGNTPLHTEMYLAYVKAPSTSLGEEFDRFDLSEISKLLLKYGANLNLLDKDGETLLHKAVKNKDYKIAALLLDYGANPNIADVDGNAPLHLATLDKSSGSIAVLLTWYGADINLANKKRETPMQMAVETQDVNVVEMLIWHGANLNLITKNEETLLYRAFVNGWHGIASQLLVYMNNINENLIKDEENLLYSASINGWNEIASKLLVYMDDINVKLIDYAVGGLLREAAVPLEVDLFFLLLWRGVKIKKADLLSDIISHTPPVIVKELMLDYEADPNFVNEVLHKAFEYGAINAVVFMLRNGANPNIIDSNGNTLLHIMLTSTVLLDSFNGFFVDISCRLVVLLLEHGADPNIVDRFGNTPLIIAVARPNRDVKMVASLLDYGANPNIANADGNTPLHIIAGGKTTKIKVLFSSRMYSQAPDNSGRIKKVIPNTLMTSQDSDDSRIITLLLEHEAKLDIANNDGKTPLQIAKDIGNDKVALLTKSDVHSTKSLSKATSAVTLNNDQINQDANSNAPQVVSNNLFVLSSNQHDAVDAAVNTAYLSLPVVTQYERNKSAVNNMPTITEGADHTRATSNQANAGDFFLNDITTQAISGFKLADSVVDGLKFIHAPTASKAYVVIHNAIQLYNFCNKIVNVPLNAMIIVHQSYHGEFKQAAITMASMSLPALATGIFGVGAVYVGYSMALYAGYSAANNIYSFYKNYGTAKYNFESLLAYEKLFDMLGLEDITERFDKLGIEDIIDRTATIRNLQLLAQEALKEEAYTNKCPIAKESMFNDKITDFVKEAYSYEAMDNILLHISSSTTYCDWLISAI